LAVSSEQFAAVFGHSFDGSEADINHLLSAVASGQLTAAGEFVDTSDPQRLLAPFYTADGDKIVVTRDSSTWLASMVKNGEIDRIIRYNNDGGGKDTLFDPDNTHPYRELDIDTDTDGKVTAVQMKFDGQPNNTAADFSAVGQVLGSALGRALAPNNQFVALVGSTVIGALGQKLAQAFSASLATNAATVNLSSVFSDFHVSIAGAGASSIASFLVAELGTALHFEGFSGQLFNAAAGGFAGSVANQIASQMAGPAGLTFDTAIAGIQWANAASSAAYGVSALFGSFLAHELVPAKSHAGAIGGQLLGAIGSFIVPGIGSLIGTILGTVVGDLFGNTPHPAATDLIDQAGDHYAATHYQTSASDGGSYSVPDQMADPALAIINGYLSTVKGAALDHSKQVTIGYQTDPASYIVGVPSHPDAGLFFSTGYAVQAAAVDLLQHLEVIGGDLLMKCARRAVIQRTDRNRGANARRHFSGSGWRPAKGATASIPCIHKRFA
jgi:outer membrane lipoprotein SlyB